MIEVLALAIVLAVSIYFVALGVASLLAPALAKQFLLGFANSSLGHYSELLVRIIVGGAFLIHSQRMLFPAVFDAFGWVLIVTTACLLFVPWRWHQRFAQRSVPVATRHIASIGVCSLAISGLLIVAIVRGTTN